MSFDSKILERLVKASGIIYENEAHWGVKEMTLFAPASAKEIELLSSSMPFPIPPSYQAFLEFSNGCLNLWPKYALLGTAGEPRDIVLQQIEKAREHQTKFVEEFGPAGEASTIQKFEKQKVPRGTPPYYFLAAHTVFAANRRGSFYFFNEAKVAKGGEMEVVDYSYDARAEFRFRTFPDFLEAKAAEMEKRIKDRKYS